MKHHTTARALITTFITLLLFASFALAGCSAADETILNDTIAASLPAESTAAAAQPTALETSSANDVSYISIDINPSIELTVKYGVVLDAAAYNDDGAEILLNVDVLGMTPDAATAALIGEFAAEGYVSPESSDAAIVITVYGDDEEMLLERLQTTATDSLTDLGITCDVVTSSVQPQIAQAAKSAGITPGKYLLVKYLAERDGITIEEARDIYGDMKMKELLNMIPDVKKVYGDLAHINLPDITGNLTPEQLDILEQARLAYETAMKAAVKAYNQAKEDARIAFQTARESAHGVYQQNHDKQVWQQAKTAAKQEMQQRYQTAKQAFVAAREQSRNDFNTAAAGLGLTEEQIEAMLEWSFECSWDNSEDWALEDDGTDATEAADHSADNGNGKGEDNGADSHGSGKGNGKGYNKSEDTENE